MTPTSRCPVHSRGSQSMHSAFTAAPRIALPKGNMRAMPCAAFEPCDWSAEQNRSTRRQIVGELECSQNNQATEAMADEMQLARALRLGEIQQPTHVIAHRAGQRRIGISEELGSP